MEQQLAATQQTPETPYGYCHCGCGQKTTTAKSTDTKKKRTKGKPLRFLPFHHLYVLGPSNPGWKNGRSVQPDKKTKYLLVYKPNHPRTTKKVYVREHILIAEKALGKYLSKRAQVHHINGDGLDNSPNNLLICEDTGYHQLIHRRTEAYRATGHADWLRCPYCKAWDSPDNMYVSKNGHQRFHRTCRARYYRERKRQKEQTTDF